MEILVQIWVRRLKEFRIWKVLPIFHFSILNQIHIERYYSDQQSLQRTMKYYFFNFSYSLQTYILLFILSSYNNIQQNPEVQMDDQYSLQTNQFSSINRSNSSALQLPMLIRNYLGEYLPASTHLILKISNSFNIKVHIKVSEEGLIIKGNLIYANGQPIKIPETYRSFFLNNTHLTKDQQSSFFEYFKDSDSFGFLKRLRIKSCEPVSFRAIEETTSELIKTIPKILTTLELAGIKDKSKKISYQLKVHELKLKREVIKLLKKKQPINQNPEKDKQRGQKRSGIKIVEKIEENQQPLSFEKNETRKGGYFQIEKKNCKITDKGDQENRDLAIKRLRKNRIGNSYCNQKLQKQWKIIEEIRNQKHCLTYWKTEKQDDSKKMIMDYIENTLETQMQTQNSIFNIVDYSSQIVEAVQILHKSGIVHRDLKPENFLVQKNGSGHVLKVIDFGQSVLMNEPFNEKELSQLGCTLPFSPLECSLQTEEGFNKRQIDIWSIGMILYELLFGKIPITYSRCFGSDIVKGWNNSDQFSVFPQIFKRKGVKVIEQIYTWIALHTLCIKQKDRIGLQVIKGIIEKTKNFLNDISKI